MTINEVLLEQWGQIALYIAAVLFAVASLRWILKRLTSLPDLPSDFDLYLRTSGSAAPEIVDVNSIYNAFRKKYGNKTVVHLEDNVVTTPFLWVQGVCAENIQNGRPIDLILNISDTTSINLAAGENDANGNVDLTNYDDKAGGPNRPHIRKIELLDSGSMINLKGLHIHELRIGKNFSGAVFITRCWIRSIKLDMHESYSPPDVRIIDTWVGNLLVSSNCAQVLEIIGGGVSRVKCAPIHSFNSNGAVAFTGNVQFKNKTPLACSSGTMLLDPQNYRNLSIHLSVIGNVDAEKYVLAFEKRMVRKDERLFVKSISFLYDASSFYGNFPERAVSWLTLIAIFSASLVFFFDASLLTVTCNELKGWQVSACGDTIQANAARSVLLSLDAIINPINIFNFDSKITTKYMVVEGWLFFQGVLSLALIALIVIGVRRKFISR